ncbi:MAG: hybrid sensor histidine kinase/response regulator [Planctomycetaceae bacterium]|nr:hybrid sensor histidine kinase/response regulator [Planctomycetaceae bacterium]
MNDIGTGPTRILFIEDSAVYERLVTQALAKRSCDFKFDIARNLGDGIEKLKSETFDIILSDLGLPDASGLDVVRKLRRDFDSMPLVVLTGLDDESVAMQALDVGAQDYLRKSELTAEGLIRALRYAIQRHQNSVMRELVEELHASREMLRTKNKRLEELNRHAHQFVDNVSHDFRTPLTVIKEYVSLISEGIVGDVNAEQCRMLNTVEDRADDLNTMVDDMLDVSKMEAGVLSVCRKKCTAQEIFDRVHPNLEKKASLRDVNLDIHIAPDLPDLYCDREKAARVMINLVVNAIKFCGTPGRVVVSAVHLPKTNEVEIRINDNGPGIAPELLTSIFGRFKQIDTVPSSQSTKGFGLGLSIAKELSRLNFGNINVESEVGQGSTFAFTIPCNDPVAVVSKFLAQGFPGDRKPQRLHFFTATLTDASCLNVAHEIDNLFGYIAREDELLFRLSEKRWLLITPMADKTVQNYIDNIQSTHDQISRNRPLGPLPKTMIQSIGNFSPESELDQLLNTTSQLVAQPNNCENLFQTNPQLIDPSIHEYCVAK